MDASASEAHKARYAKETIPFRQTGKFKSAFVDYLERNPALSSVAFPFPSLETLEALAAQRNFTPQQRQTLVEVLTDQYKAVGIDYRDVSGLIKLAEEGTCTVTTGHQLCIYLGPLYTVLKALTIIKISEEIQAAYPHRKVVPVFWLATEDHDLEEISHLRIEGQDYAWNPRHTGPAGHQTLEGLKETLANIWPRLPAYLEKYTTFKNLAMAQAWLLHTLFGAYGLVVLDAGYRRLKQAAIPLFRKELLEAFVEPSVTAATHRLEEQGYQPQISVREINLFLLAPFARERIVRQRNGSFTAGKLGTYSEQELLVLLNTEPERFSPNVALRPIYQELILPNLAYVGGPAELVYWLQLCDVFEAAGVAKPAVWPRAHATIISEKDNYKLKKIGLKPKDLFQDYSDLLRHVLETRGTKRPDTSALEETFQHYLQQLETLTLAQDPNLVQAVAAEKARLHKQIQPGLRRIEKAYVRQNALLVDQFDKLFGKLTANGGLQERSESYLTFALQDKDFIDNLYDSISVTDHSFALVTYSQKNA